MYQVRCIYYEKEIAGYDMKSTKLSKNGICIRKYIYTMQPNM